MRLSVAPELLNDYAGIIIILAVRAHKDEIGCMAEEKIYDFDFTGVERLHRPNEELSLRALVRALVQTLLEHFLWQNFSLIT